MATLSASIMAHPVRARFVEELQENLDRKINVSWDQEGPPSSDKERRWRNGRRAWMIHDPNAEWHMVIQDDAITSPDILAGLEKALDHVPDDVGIVSPYFGTKRPNQAVVIRIAQEARKQDASWARMRSLNWGVAIAVRTETIRDMLEWCDLKVVQPYDTRVGRYYRDHLHQDCFYTWPSLVDHRQTESLIAHSDIGRYAHNFHETSALELDWTRDVVRDPRVERYLQNTQRRQWERRHPGERNPRSLRRV